MRLEELEDQLPWGLHDAYLERMDIDWVATRAQIYLRIMMSEHQDLEQRAVIVIGGLVYCLLEPPAVGQSGIEASTVDGLWVQPEEVSEDDRPATVPPAPKGCFLHRFFVSNWNSFIYVCGRDAMLTWLEAQPTKAKARTRAQFPGETLKLDGN